MFRSLRTVLWSSSRTVALLDQHLSHRSPAIPVHNRHTMVKTAIYATALATTMKMLKTWTIFLPGKCREKCTHRVLIGLSSRHRTLARCMYHKRAPSFEFGCTLPWRCYADQPVRMPEACQLGNAGVCVKYIAGTAEILRVSKFPTWTGNSCSLCITWSRYLCEDGYRLW